MSTFITITAIAAIFTLAVLLSKALGDFFDEKEGPK